MVAGLGLALCNFAAAKADNPLERMTPVPKTEPIPVADFFRPSLFSNPKLNPAGTHFIASTTIGVDRTEMVLCTIAEQFFGFAFSHYAELVGFVGASAASYVGKKYADRVRPPGPGGGD